MQFGGGHRSGTDDFSQFMTILTLNRQRTEKDSPLCRLIQLINLLQDLLNLKTKFRVKMPLAEFMADNKAGVVHSVLDWVLSTATPTDAKAAAEDNEEVADLMDGFLVSYMQKHRLNLNQTLMDYLVGLLRNTAYNWHWHVGAAPWEAKVAQLLPYITSVDEKSQVGQPISITLLFHIVQIAIEMSTGKRHETFNKR